ncbi:MAG: acyl carrier protein [Saprospiraceae bacterium]|nr:acyl carrier protein [Saprospiraceae bacterium]
MVINRTGTTTENQIIQLVSWILDIPSSYINPYTDFIDDLYLDNMERELLIARLERSLGILLSPEEVASIDTIQDISRCFSQHAAA